MSLIPCDRCHKRVPEKLCQATWAWYPVSGDRVAYRERLCTGCYAMHVLALDKPLDFDALACPACGISTEHDMDATYLTVYVPGGGKQQFEMPTCPSCAPMIRAGAIESGVLLEARDVGGPGGGPPTQPPTRESYWDSIGIGPRDAA